MPNRVFLYVGSPVKKIVGFSAVTSIELVNFNDAKKYLNSGKISEDELMDYIGENGNVHAIHINDIKIFKSHIDLTALRDNFNFNPPQSFSKLSVSFERWLVENGK